MTDLVVLLAFTGAVILIATWITGAETIEQLSTSLIERTALRTEGQLQSFFGTVRKQVLVGQGWAATDILDATDYEAMNKLFVPILEQHPQLSSMMVANSNGAEYLLLRDPVDPHVWSNRIVQADAWGKRVYNREWNSETGQLVEGFDTLDYDPRKRIWFQRALDTTTAEPVYWTKPVIFYVTKDPGITASTQWVGPSESPLTTVVAYDLLLMDISRFTTNLNVSKHGKAFVMVEDNETGELNVVGLPRDAGFQSAEAIRDTLTFVPPDAAVADTAAQLPPADSLHIPALTAATQAWKTHGQPDDPLPFSVDGENWWAGFRLFQQGPNRFWIGVVVPEQDFSAGIRRQQILLIGLVIGVLLIGMIRAVTLSRRFSTPIVALVRQSERISRGDLEPQTPIVSEVEEIRRLAEAHDNMREGLKSVIKLEKLERDLDIAREIQLGLLPQQSPQTPEFEIAGWNRPADKTGGDYYDWLVLPNGKTLFTLADVAGHGIGPALIVSVYRAYMRATAGDGTGALNDVIGRLNELLCVDMPEGRFITAVVGVVRSEDCRVELLSAGHAPMFFYESATATLHNWEADDLPLGITGGLTFNDARQIPFAPGDTLVLTTDGFFEATNSADEPYGIETLEQFIRDHHSLPPDEFIQRLYQDVEKHVAGEVQADDLTALVIKRTTNPG
ncbi:Phosphoserine phosphatase RsbU [Symmachiella macrocystis]|uniref:Phosphoserine phosphatase RsbU n=1 Tax=Symmachiella macrocystis TaxID=2527985 RepID=A0A5C6B5P5_9PLAN|nr:SpoIIE family protein phosphatase [Symmachiella macrocystis]TWU06576.1 Phosphoserine phosphatase RsbU [Symmachiella macrocystis]